MAEMTWRTEDLTLALRITESHRDYQQITVSASRDGFSATRLLARHRGHRTIR
jgi:hypothetical protein